VRKIEPLPGVSLARLTPPPAIPEFLFRQRLIERLNHPAPRANFIVAPGGFGKTVLASQWAAQIDGPTFWYSIDTHDGARDSFFHIIQGLRMAVPGIAPWAENYISEEFDYLDLTKRLANELGAVGETVNLIWDGGENFSPEFTPALQVFAEVAPLNLRTISIRGSMPDQSFSRAAKLGALEFLTATDLRFDDREMRSLLAQHDLDYDDPQVRKKFDGVHGWPAGVQIILHQIQSGNASELTSLNDEVIIASTVNSLSAEDREYLGRLVFLDEITLDLAQRLHRLPIATEEDHPLLRLAHKGAFISEAKNGVFSMNSIIRKELLRRIAQDHEKFKGYAIATADLYETDGDPVRAIEVLAMAGEEDQVVKKAYFYMSRIINGGDAKLLRSWGNRIAPLLVLGGNTDLNKTVLDAYAELLTGNNLGVLSHCISLENSLSALADPHRYVIEIWGLRARASFNLGNFSEVIRITDEMLESPYTREQYGAARIRITNVLRIAVAASFLREDLEATIRYTTLISGSEDPLVNSVIVPATQALTALAEGRYKLAFEYANAALTSSIRHNVVGVYSSFDSVYVMADYLRESGQEELSLELLDTYIERAENFGVWSWYAALMGKKALVKSQLGQISEALIVLRKAREKLIDSIFDPEIFRILDEQELLVRVKLVDTERIGELLYRLPQTATPQAFNFAYAALKSPGGAKALLDSYPTDTPRLQLNKELISAEVFKENPHIAMVHLNEAVEIAMANGARSIFLNQSEEIQNHLLTLSGRKPTVYMEQLASAIRKGQMGSARDLMGLAEPLTKREIDILRRLSSGLPITQIAATLHISHNTIKTHLKSVYRKLNVESRAEAVERGKELLLI
jgi:LuxR family transcriptional regulator, maltose regulon positive regulatory protein